MRWIPIIALVLIASASAACLLPTRHASVDDARQLDWVHTRDGWEPRIGWEPAPVPYEPSIHPAVVATGEVLLSLIALIAFPGRARCPSPPSRCARPALSTVRRRHAARGRAHFNPPTAGR